VPKSPSQEPPTRGLSIALTGIEKRYGARLALRGVSLGIGPGECVALVGANGSGKTTLLRIAALLVRPSTGQVAVSEGGSSASSSSKSSDELMAVKRRIGMVAHHTLLYDELSAEENLTLFAELYGLDRVPQRVPAALEACGLAGRNRDLVRTFSRGMRQRLAIARAMLASPGLLLLDEPATGLDPEGQHWLGATLARLRGDGCTIVMSTHAPGEARSLVTRAVRLVAGAVVEDSGSSGDPGPLLQAARAAHQEET
jgi:heme exporter protein A